VSFQHPRCDGARIESFDCMITYKYITWGANRESTSPSLALHVIMSTESKYAPDKLMRELQRRCIMMALLVDGMESTWYLLLRDGQAYRCGYEAHSKNKVRTP
jgi:hypothetical protein